MPRRPSLQQTFLAASTLFAAGSFSSLTSSANLLPDIEAASSQPNAIHLFNSIHSALRQFGSSLHHNGLSFYPVVVPEGNHLYHGTHQTGRPPGLEWLAFEIEHALQFARSISPDDFPGRRPGNPPGERPDQPSRNESALKSEPWSLHGQFSTSHLTPPSLRVEKQTTPEVAAQVVQLPFAKLSKGQADMVNDEDEDDDDDDDESRRPRPFPDRWSRGYLQLYRAARPLNLIYIAGESAAKCTLGTLDSQDYILLGRPIDDDQSKRPLFGDFQRAINLCELGKEWGIDGWIRMEAGFEIIYCDFSEGAGLDLISEHGSPFRNETGSQGPPLESWFDGLQFFEWLRAASERYHGMVRGRAEIDFSGMVSAFFYAINTTNPDPSRQELPRITETTSDERRLIKNRLQEVTASRKGKATSTIQWQGIVDLIVARYSDRIAYLASTAKTADRMRSELGTLLNMFSDFPSDAGASGAERAQIRCRTHYLAPAIAQKASWTPEDEAILSAIESVAGLLCSGLFTMRGVLARSNGTEAAEVEAAVAVQSLAEDLMAELRWTTWKECGRCANFDEICAVPMFPMGADEDYSSPRCKNMTEMRMGAYWRR